MGLDISKIQNAELQKLAHTVDTDEQQGVLSKEEFELFKQEAAKKTDISTEEFNQAMGLYTTNPASATEPASVTDGMTKKQAKKWNKADRKHFFRQLEDLTAGGIKRTGLSAELQERVSNPELKQAVADVLALMPATYKSVDDVKDQHRSVLEKMDKAGIKDDLHKDILKALEEMGKNEVKSSVLANINDRYLAELQSDKDKGVKRTEEEIMDKIKKDLKNEKKYKDEVKDQFEVFEKDVVMEEARRTMSQAVYGVLDETKWKKVRKEVKQALKDSGEWDKYTKKALKNSNGRITTENQARLNNVTKHTVQSTEDVMDAMGKRMDVFIALKEAGLVKQLENGDWDLSELSEIIGTQVGDDNQLNRNAKIDKAISEKLRTAGKLSVDSKLASLTEKEATALVKLCGYDIEGKNWGKIILNSLLGAAAGGASGAASGAAAAATNPQHRIVKPEDIVNHNTNLEIKGDFDKIDLSQLNLPEGCDLTQTSTALIIKISQIITYPEMVIEISKHIGETAMKAAIGPALVGAALGFLSGMKDTGEIPVTVTQFTETDIKKYAERVQKETPEYAAALIPLAQSFVKDGKWDYQAYMNFLNDAAGDGGKLNKEELIGALRKIYTKPAPIKVEEQQQQQEEVKDDKIAVSETKTDVPVYAEVPTIDGTTTSWKKIAGQYDCLIDKYDEMGAIRMLKIAQAITNGDYSKENMEKLLKLSNQGRKYMQGIEGLDYKVYENALDATYLGTDVKVPAELAECVRDPQKSLKEEKDPNATDAVKPTGSASDRVKTGTEEHWTYGLRVNGGTVETFTSMKDRDDRVAEIKKDSPDAKIEKVTWEDLNKTE